MSRPAEMTGKTEEVQFLSLRVMSSLGWHRFCPSLIRGSCALQSMSLHIVSCSEANGTPSSWAWLEIRLKFFLLRSLSQARSGGTKHMFVGPDSLGRTRKFRRFALKKRHATCR
jgi:hypothetical protein